MKPTLVRWGSLYNQEVSTSASKRRACGSDPATFDQNKQILRTSTRTGSIRKFVVTLAFPSKIVTPLRNPGKKAVRLTM